ncbi:hypothetical protein [Alysiella crassa]|uniref:Uncharacterized protein n=1 Tax=Alysiella crassa TaxID=153491 RepID=A0A376BLW2_9NEIS|nr:hypothetical protein [Alysiella crassa]UOP07195.1 hypothetical protein LVJ80_01685 [Alysiella crassa]SSY70638.1 Uncharacterised protein [Alysiella crassa]
MKSLKQLFTALCLWALWFGLTVVLAQTFKMLNTTHYQSGDTPDKPFRVAILAADGSRYAVPFQEAQTMPEVWNRQPEKPCQQEDCLFQADDGSLIFHNEGALWYSESRYRIVGNRLEPVSHVVFNVGDVFFAGIGAFILLKLGKYGFYRWRYRRAPEQLAAYHRAVWASVKRWLIWVAVLVLFILGINILSQVA